MYLGFILVLKSRPRNITYKSLCVWGGGGGGGDGVGKEEETLLLSCYLVVCVCVCVAWVYMRCVVDECNTLAFKHTKLGHR